MARRHLLALAALLAIPSSAGLAAGVSSARGPAYRAAGETPRVERLIRGCANRQRAKRGLRALRADKGLGRAARMHARAMLEQGYFNLVDPHGSGPAERVERVSTRRWRLIGENIAAGYADTARACSGWMSSPGHRANILRRGFTHVGGGYAHGPGGYGRYYVQVFGTLQR
jgi:uncharacterized protein YkwD